MPIYAYKCASCGHAKDVLQKLSDAPLTVCPACGAESFSKQVTAAGFQLKGSGWYATDFRNGSAAPAPAAGDKADKADKADTAAKPTDSAAKPAESTAKPADAPAAKKPDAPAASAGAGSRCA
ncbi:FmdB family zinc ribbon protein [Ramlibacter sp. WS9]|uniref:FmdB family zinc ribbon protein n=1 Tax=Ramlibacter sp. WS9 TaxID=1882741 RepID=UPI0011423A5F|nr:FmdB family zinc ribbon protein [Ramlibacter sp. WS9]ROZ72173.1 zinc ribbon domain-containing protein [Ramlibacter sp. WS9]